MSVVLAALDNSLAVNPVLVTARALARVLGARVEAIHVVGEGVEAAGNAVRAAGVPLRLTGGPVVERLVEAGDSPEVDVMVIGARGTLSRDHALGSTALAVVTALRTPVVVVPPDARVAPRFRRVLVPLDGSTASLAPWSIVELASGAGIDVIGLHVSDEDEPEPDAQDVLARFCPWGIDSVRVEQRTGNGAELVPRVADETDADVIALGWAQQLSPARAPLVQATFERAKVPVMLIPVQTRPETGKEPEDDGGAVSSAAHR